jgi:hypothetical protein
MAKKWAEVEANPEYQKLSPQDKEAARTQYFEQVVKPQVPPVDLEAARSQFLTQTKPNEARRSPKQMYVSQSDDPSKVGIFKAIQSIDEGIHEAGGKVTDVASMAGMSPGRAALEGTVANVGLNAIPMMFGGTEAKVAEKVAPKVGEMFANARTAAAEKLPVPMRMTKGQATRDPVQLRREELLAQTDEGKAIRNLHIEQNRDLISNLENVRDRAAPKSMSLEDVGRRVAGEKSGKMSTEGALVMKETASSDRVSQAYQKARSSPEVNNPVNPKPLIDWLTENGAAAASVPEINSMAQMLKKFGAVTTDASGQATAGRNLTMGEMEEVRKLAVKLDPNDGKAASHFMKEIKRTIDASTEKAGGDLYKAARAERVRHAMEFEEPKAIAQLLDSKSRTDRAVALENVWSSVVTKGSISDLDRVRSTLLKSEDRTIRDAGRKAWRDIVGNTAEYIKTEATKSVATDAAGSANISPAALKRALDRIGDKKLDMIFGKSSADTMRQISRTAQDVKTMPPNKAGSTTVPNFLAVMDRIVGKVPIVGSTTMGAAKVVRDLGKSGTAMRDTQEALGETMRPRSLSDIGKRVAATASKFLLPLSELGNQQ